MKALRHRLASLEGERQYSTFAEWVDALEREDRGEPVDWSALKPLHPAAVATLEALPDE